MPRVSDGVVYRVLQNLLVLQGERLSYRTLDVEQIGSVYEAMMGFALRLAEGPSHRAAARTHRRQPPANCSTSPPDEARRRGSRSRPSARSRATAVREAATIEALVAALEKRISPATPTPLRAGRHVPAADRRAAALRIALHARARSPRRS